jgi:autotransporter-associated beta strand protein
MKPTHRNPLLRTFLLAATSLVGVASFATAGTLYWDGNGTGATGNPPTAGVGGNGNWDTSTTPNWWDGNAYQLWNVAGGQDIADFRVAASTVTVSGTVNVNRMDFSIATNVFSGGTINFGAGGIMDTKTVSGQTINSVISGPLKLQATGNTTSNLSNTACFTLTGDNSGLTDFELALNTANNHIIIDSAGALGAAASPVKFTTGVINLGNVDGVNRTYNAWTTTLAGGTIRGRFGNSTLTGPVTLTANSGMESRAGTNAKLTLSSAATINLNGNTLKLSAQNSAGSGIELNGNISGTSGILNIAASSLTNGANGTGIVTLAGTNSYTGGTTVTTSGAILNLRKLSSLPASGTTAMSTGTTLSLGVAASGDHFSSTDVDNLFAGTPAGNLANVTLTGTVHVGMDTTAGDYIYATSVASVAKNLAKLGANKLTLTGTNAYTGTTTVHEGTLALSGSGTLGTGALSLNGGNFDLGGASASSGAVTVALAAPGGDTISNGSLTTTATTASAYQATNTLGNAIISANLLANGTAGFTKTGAGGTVSLSGTNTYSGGTTVTTGTLTFLNTNAKPATGTTTPAAAATLGLGVGASAPYFNAADVASLLAGTLANVSGTNAYTVGVDTSAGDFLYASDLGTSTRALTKLGANTLTLSGNNTFDKLITVNEGTLKAGSATAFNNTGTLAVLPGATFDLNGFDAKLISTTSNTGTITTTGAGTGTDTLTLSASNVDGITNLFTDNGTRKLKIDFTSAASPAAARQATTNANNTYSGGLVLGNVMRVQVAAGTVGSPGAIVNGPFGRGPITVNGGATNATGAQIWFSAPNRTIVNDIVVNGNAGNGSRGGTFRLSVTGSTISGNIDSNGTDTWFGCEGTSTLLLSGKLTGAKGFRFFNSNGTFPLTITLNNATPNPSDYLGNTTVDASSHTLVLGAANQIPNGTGKGNVAVNFGKLDLAGFSETINGLSGGAGASVDNLTAATPANTLTLGDGDATGTTFSGAIANTAGVLSLIKTGSGTQTFAGGNTYTGTTTVNGGTLLINGSQTGASGAVQVNAATLGGSGTIGGAVTVAAAGTIAPGTDGTIESLDITANTSIAGTFACDVSGATTDQLLVTGDLTLTGSTLDINEITPATGGTYVIASYTGTRTGTLGGTLPAGYSVNYDDANKEVELIVVGSAYVTWGGPYGLGAGTEGGDLDNDGLTNFEEFAFGLIPNSGSSVNPILLQLDKTNGQFTYQRLAASGLTYTVWTSPDLSTWTLDSGAIQSPTIAGANQNVVVTLSATPKPLTATKLFVRVLAN